MVFKNAFFVAALMSITAVRASGAEVEAYFDAATNKLVLPHLEVNGQVYFARLVLIDAATLTFKAELSSLTDITPSAEVIALKQTASAIVGTWKSKDSTDTGVVIFRADGTYTQTQAPGQDSECMLGGIETGTYRWDTTTGILIPVVLSDGNKTCGLSNPRGGVPLRFFVEGINMKVLEFDTKYKDLQFDLVKSAN